jgi:hypothetical protein
VTATLPLRLRNRLAETILAALHDGAARRELTVLAGDDGARAWLADEDVGWAPSLAARARTASAALADRPLLAPADLRQTLAAAATLFDAGLYFEVHEVLEPHWASAGGETREVLQGLIQVAVAWQHLVNGNVAGARSLFVEGGTRLHRSRLLGLDLDPFARATLDAAARVDAGLSATPPPFPH